MYRHILFTGLLLITSTSSTALCCRHSYPTPSLTMPVAPVMIALTKSKEEIHDAAYCRPSCSLVEE